MSIITPDGKIINAKIFTNPLEQLKDIKYTIKIILKDENGVELRNAEGEYAAVVSHKEGTQEIEELVVVKKRVGRYLHRLKMYHMRIL